MNKPLLIILSILSVLFTSCDRELEEAQVDLGYDFQPLEIGLYWIYEVNQTIYFGENDSELFAFFYKDRIRTFYLNAEGEHVFIVQRSKSTDNINWINELEYTLRQGEVELVRTMDNLALVTLVFPPNDGVTWDGNSYRNDVEDDFKLIKLGDTIRIIQEDSDDEVTYRDIRYEVYDRTIGLVEKYDEVLTYCSRNDCLGDMLIDSGFKTQLTLISHGKD